MRTRNTIGNSQIPGCDTSLFSGGRPGPMVGPSASPECDLGGLERPLEDPNSGTFLPGEYLAGRRWRPEPSYLKPPVRIHQDTASRILSATSGGALRTSPSTRSQPTRFVWVLDPNLFQGGAGGGWFMPAVQAFSSPSLRGHPSNAAGLNSPPRFQPGRKFPDLQAFVLGPTPPRADFFETSSWPMWSDTSVTFAHAIGWDFSCTGVVFFPT